MSTTILTVPPDYHFDENDDASYTPVFVRGGAIYKFLVDGVGVGTPSGGGTEQIFIQKSVDNGATWADVTPVAPIKSGQNTPSGQRYLRFGDVVYCSNWDDGVGVAKLNFFRFDLSTESWLTDGAKTLFTTVASLEGTGAAMRSTGQIVFAAGTNTALATRPTVCAVYDTATDTWPLALGTVPGLIVAWACAAACDSTDLTHFWTVKWSGANYGAGTATLLHFTIDAANVISATDLVYTFVNQPNQFQPNLDVGLAVAYLDVTPNLRKLAFPLGLRDGSNNVTALTLFIADEAPVPVYTQVPVATGENFAQVTLDTSEICGMPPFSLLPVEISTGTQLWIFWEANGLALNALNVDWPNVMRRMSYTNGVFSAITTEYNEVSQRMMGALYPVIIAQAGDNVSVGGHTPTIDYRLFLSSSTKYQSLALWWMGFDIGGPPLTLGCGNPPLGQVGIPYSSSLVAAGGVLPYLFSIIAGALPPGLLLNALTGLISGLPNTAGTFAFTAQVMDAQATIVSVDCSIRVLETRQTSLNAAGGSAGFTCRKVRCFSNLGVCIGWGPLSVVKDREGLRVVYQDSRGDTRTFILRDIGGIDPFEIIARFVAGWERAPFGYHNPGNIKARRGVLDKSGDLVVFPNARTGHEALLEVIRLSLEPDGEVL